jgi:hypothetical protein
METNFFLTQIAQKYNPKIKSVEVCDLAGICLGAAQKKIGVETYRITIDRDRLICPYQVLFTLYHEVGHIVLFHLGYRYYTKDSSEKLLQEDEADDWAHKQMGIVDENGSPKKEYSLCYKCTKTKSKHCLKKGEK